MRTLSLAMLLAHLASVTQGADYLASDAASFQDVSGKLKPGDSLILASGTWADARLKLHAEGTAETPVIVRAETPGKTILTGDSRLSLSGKHITVEGLLFKDPTGEEAIELRISSKQLATDCRITRCAVVNALPKSAEGKTARFLSIYGSGHRIDHCQFEGKTSPGTTVVVWLDNAKPELGHHRLDHNYFGPRERLGKNGGETIRIGDSKTSMQKAACIVEKNLFERCDGEAECISNKSCGNVYRENTFASVSGTLTLRHGNGCEVLDNVFLGRGAKGSGGIRIIGEKHLVKGNHLEGLLGDEERSAICFMLGIPGSPDNGYFQVKGATIEGNTILNCATPIVIGVQGDKKASLPPIEVNFRQNTIHAPSSNVIDARCDLAGFTWESNRFQAQSLGIAEHSGWHASIEKPASSEPTVSHADVGPGW